MPAGEPMRDPARALRGIMSGLLLLEGVTVLLALAAVAHLSGLDAGLLVALAVGLIGLCAAVRRPWVGAVGTALQVLVVAAGVLAWPLFVLGLLFGGMWLAGVRMGRDLAREQAG